MGLIIAVALIGISALGVTLWLKRRPTGKLGAPPAGGLAVLKPPIILLIVALGIMLPLFGASLVVVLMVNFIAQKWGNLRAAQ